MNEENHYCEGNRYKSNSQVPSKCIHYYNDFRVSNNNGILKTNNSKFTLNIRKSSYEKYEELGESRKDLDFDMTREEFKDLMDNRGTIRPSWVKVRWRCIQFNHKWYAIYHNIKNGTGCPHCPRNNAINYEDYMALGNSREDLNFNMTKDEFYKAIDKRGNKNPSDVQLSWRCISRNHIWSASYNAIRQGNGCNKCPKGVNVIDYQTCVDLSASRNDIVFDMNQEEFEAVIEKRGLIKPSYVKLRWKCIKYGHKWWASYHNIYMGKGCVFCFKTSYEKCIELGDSREDLSFHMNRLEFNKIMGKKGNKTPNTVLLKWRCLNESNHIWWASFNGIDGGNGCPLCGERTRVIGEQLHYILQYLNNKYFEIKKCPIKIEGEVDPNRKFRADILIDRNLEFLTKIERFQQVIPIPNIIKKISVDFTFSLDPIKILEKCFKKYQSKERFLIIVLLQEQKGRNKEKFNKLINKSNSIKMKDHILVINFDDYLKLINLIPNIQNWRNFSDLEKKILSKFQWAIENGMKAIKSDLSLDKLIETAKFLRKFSE
ncbi:MAG: hypothetical protein ACFFCV_14330 [Promethearchaeota archaeon]